MNQPVILSLVGRKGSGKSEMLENLIALLSQKGFRIGVIKHLAREDFEIDEPGKDTFRYRMQGAGKVILSGRKRLAVFANREEEMPMEELLSYFQDYDLVFLEGYFLETIPKIEIYQKEGSELLPPGLRNVVGCFSSGETSKLAALIEKRFLQKEVSAI